MRQPILAITVASILSASTLFAGLSGSSAFAATAPVVQTPTPTQLPRTVKPSHYAIAIAPNAAEANFTGQVTISIDVLKPTSSITLNAHKLAFHSVELISESSKASVKPGSTKINEETQTATFTFDRPLAAGNYRLAIAYSGVINSQANGLFYVDYDTDTKHQRALYTQFENSDARRFVPSWDEPNYKATFDLQATVPGDQMVVSNMPVISATDLHDGRRIVKFGTSPKMSTYLLFFGLGDFERTTAHVDGTEVGVITQRGSLSQAAFSLASSTQILHEYNDYFGVRYPLPKLDNIAAPGSSQFFSAMENWGAIFTFENAILLDPTISTQNDKENSFTTAAHEIAHQWFGDLVTMRWWDDLWLNEGFASWMENRTTERLHPEWNTKLLTAEVHEKAMELDSLSTTHPIVQRIETVEQASQAFDAITYQKGESVIRMLENYVGAAAWRDGVRLYMKQHAYGNTSSDDFWRAIERASAKPIITIAHDFTLQPGIPLIQVSEASCKAGITTLQLTQSEFSRDHLNKPSLRWHVPVTVQSIGSTASTQTLLSSGKTAVHLPGCEPVIVNPAQTGYFRTLYAPKQFKALADHFAALAPIDQLGLLSDSWALGLAGLQPMSEVLNLANAMPLNSDPQVWAKVTGIYSGINQLYRFDPKRQRQFNQFAITRLTPLMTKISWNARADDTSAITNLREQLIQTLSQLDDSATITEARRRYNAQTTDPSAFPVELRKVILSVIALHADTTAWDKLHAAAHSEKSPMIKSQLYYLISTSKNPELAARAMNIALTDEPGATNSAGMLDQVARLYPDTVFDFLIAHLSQVEKFVDGSSRSRYLPRLAAASSEPAMIEKLNAYAKAHLPASALGNTKTAIATIHYHIKVRAQRLPEIDAWLATHE